MRASGEMIQWVDHTSTQVGEHAGSPLIPQSPDMHTYTYIHQHHIHRHMPKNEQKSKQLLYQEWTARKYIIVFEIMSYPNMRIKTTICSKEKCLKYWWSKGHTGVSWKTPSQLSVKLRASYLVPQQSHGYLLQSNENSIHTKSYTHSRWLH